MVYFLINFYVSNLLYIICQIFVIFLKALEILVANLIAQY